MNVGIDYCHGEYVLCVDADSYLDDNSIKYIADAIKNNDNVVALGGRVVPKEGIIDCINNPYYCVKNFLQSYQDLEYNIAFNVARPLFDVTKTTMLLSGAISIFRKDLIIKLQGYSTETVAEDMEIVMRIRQFSASTNKSIDICYMKDLICYTQVPWNIMDLAKQRIRWTYGLSQVLWKYKEILYKDCYLFKEKIAYCYYLLFELFSPLTELIGIISLFLYDSTNAYVVLFILFIIQLIITIIGSYKSIKKSIELSNNKIKAIIKIIFLLLSFVSIYHIFHSFVRLISIPYYKIKNNKNKTHGNAWVSPKRE